MPYVARNYEKIQHVAFETPTHSANSAGGKLLRERLEKIYTLINTDQLSLDARCRLVRLASIVEKARTKISLNGDSPTTLKVFTVPEFYFRPQKFEAGKQYRAYKEDCKEAILDNLQVMFSDPIYKDWLIAPGTILWKSKLDTVEGLEFQANVNRTVVGTNTASIVKGGQKELPMVIADKIFPSDADKLGKWGDHDKIPYVKQFMRSLDKRKFALGRFDNLDVGIEVCLDHSRGVLRKTVQEIGKATGSWNELDLQILVACGKTANPFCLAGKLNTLFLRNDGNNATPSQTFRVTSQDIKDLGNWGGFDEIGKQNDSLKREKMDITVLDDKEQELDFPDSLVIYTPQPIR